MTELLELAQVFGATSAVLMVVVVFVWRQYQAERERNITLTDELLKTVRAYESFTTKTRTALEQQTEIIKARGGV